MVLKECFEHGYFRGDSCPICTSEGKMLMSDWELDKLGRTMAGILRHFPERYGLFMDENGWVELKEMVSSIKDKKPKLFGRWLREHHVIAVVDTDEKGRYQIDGSKIRATYAHSVDIKLDFPKTDIPEELFYPASCEEAEILIETGLKPSERKMVHLSETYDNAKTAGSYRVKSPVILKVDATLAIEEGINIMKAGKTVYLSDEIPSEFVSIVPGEDMSPSDESGEAPDSEEGGDANSPASEEE